MTPKPKLKVDWPSVIKGSLIILSGVGVTGTGVVMLGGNETEASDLKPMVVQHISTDSVRWVYTEKRLERIEALLLRIDEKIDANHRQ